MAQEALPGAPADPSSVRQELERLRKVEAELASVRPREAKLQTALAEKNLENLELRWRVAAAREATNPSLAQVRKVQLPKKLNTYLNCVKGWCPPEITALELAATLLQPVMYSTMSGCAWSSNRAVEEYLQQLRHCESFRNICKSLDPEALGCLLAKAVYCMTNRAGIHTNGSGHISSRG